MHGAEKMTMWVAKSVERDREIPGADVADERRDSHGRVDAVT
jgi:hypothetical protein